MKSTMKTSIPTCDFPRLFHTLARALQTYRFIYRSPQTQNVYTLNFTEEWGRALYDFTRMLRDELREELIMIIGLEEDDLVYDRNVLVVVRSKTDDVIRRIARVALEVNREYGASINFYMSAENEQN